MARIVIAHLFAARYLRQRGHAILPSYYLAIHARAIASRSDTNNSHNNDVH